MISHFECKNRYFNFKSITENSSMCPKTVDVLVLCVGKNCVYFFSLSLSLWSEIPNALRFSFIFLHFLAMVSLEFLQKKTNSAEVTKEDISFSGDFTTLSLSLCFFLFSFLSFLSLSCSLIQLILPKGSLR